MCPTVDFAATDFPSSYAHLNTPGTIGLDCSRLDLFRCMISLASQRPFGFSRIREIGFFRAISFGYVDPLLFTLNHCAVNDGQLGVGPLFATMTRSEKRPVSQRIGEAFAKLYSESRLDIARLFVVEAARASAALTVTYADPGLVSPKEPDLIGMSKSGDWHVIEAKGSSRFENRSSVYTRGKKQATNLATIDGMIPATRSVCMTFLDVMPFTTMLRDPEERGRLDVSLNRQVFDQFYYRGFGTLLQGRRGTYRRTSILGNEYVFERPYAGVEIGLDARVYESLRDGRIVPGDLDLPSSVGRNVGPYALGSDGIALRATDEALDSLIQNRSTRPFAR